MKLRNKVILLLLIISQFNAFGQNEGFPSDPAKAKFITTDLANFWKALDSIEISKNNPFEHYIRQGTKGLQGFIDNRIINADSLLHMINKRRTDYEAKRDIELKIREKEKEVIPYFYKLKELYPKTKFPPVYFVFGRFNSGGTSSEGGLIIGAEKLNDLNSLPNLVIHESIHFQQTFPKTQTTLLEQSILEGTADFIAGLVTGAPINKKTDSYANNHRDRLLSEFVLRMNKTDMVDWLYGTSKKDDRPNDLGYWMGYKIVEAYYLKMDNKKEAIDQILNIQDYNVFLQKSGFLKEYLR